MRDLAGQIVAITGGSSGIGAATARALARRGAKLVLGARHPDRLDTVVDELNGDAVAVEMDVRDPDAARRLVADAMAAFGGLDVLVANAGIGTYGGIMDNSDERLKDMMETNVAGTVWTVRAAVPHFLEKGEGDIVIIASTAGLRSGPNQAVYAATKFAQIGLASGLDQELRPKNIRVSALCPGGVETEFAMGHGRTPDMPVLAEMMRPEDIAEAVVTILSQPRKMRTLVWSMRGMYEPD
jgi:NADP-dependent 3-hydroxy acid dehydrogenase YdfG